jgi:mannitol 2-dehydrogenase
MMTDAKFVSWIEDNVKFPNSMVDRITPVTSDMERQWIHERFDYYDDWPVFCEPFRQWVMEDSFVNNERPPFEKVGVTFAKDVVPYEFMKIRILNGGHGALCYPSALLGLHHVHQAMEHEVISKFLDVLERTEIIPTLGPVPNTSLPEYWELIAGRFANSCMNDTLSRICFDGANRQPKFIIPVITDQLKRRDQHQNNDNDSKGGDDTGVDGLAIVSALWCRYCEGTDEAGEKIAPNDPIWDRLNETACKAKATKDPSCWLDMEDIYGTVGTHPQFVDSFSKAWHMIQERGVEATLQNYIDEYSK